MSMHRPAFVQEWPWSQRISPRTHLRHEVSFLRHGAARPPDRPPSLPVPMLDWASDLFSEVHPVADDHWITGELSVRDGLPAGGRDARYDLAGVTS
jgi:hypothetical protein